jgi:hypothetical protein
MRGQADWWEGVANHYGFFGGVFIGQYKEPAMETREVKVGNLETGDVFFDPCRDRVHSFVVLGKPAGWGVLVQRDDAEKDECLLYGSLRMVQVRRPAEATIKRSELRRGMEVRNADFPNLPPILLLERDREAWKCSESWHVPSKKITFARWPNETSWRRVVDDAPASCPTCGKDR